MDHLRSEVKRPFSETLNRLDNLVHTAIAEYRNYEDRPLDENYFHNPTLQNAISATHAALTEVHNIAQRHVEEYTNLICKQMSTISELERTVDAFRTEIDTLLQSKMSLECTLASLQDSVNHAQRMLDDTRRKLDEQRRELADGQQTRDRLLRLSWIPFMVIPLVITAVNVRDTEDRVRDLERDLRGHEEARENAQAQVDQESAKIAHNERAAAIAIEQLERDRTSLDNLRQEMNTLLKMGENVKSSTVFIAEFQGRVNVLYETNRLEVMFYAVIRSLGDLLPFIAAHVDNQVAVLASSESMQHIRQLLANRILPSTQDAKEIEF